MRIAYVNQPLDLVRPPIQNSLGLWTYEVARRVARSHEVFVYLQGGRLRFGGLHEDGVHFRWVPSIVDRKLVALLERVAKGSDPVRPLFASRWYHYVYGLGVARDLRRQKCDVAHVLNFTQFVPIIRRYNPTTKIVLHMQCEWLTQLDHDEMERRLGCADLMLGCSEFIAEEARRAFPRLADRCRAVHNGVDVERFRGVNGSAPGPGDGGKRLLFVGRVSPEKGVHVLVEAFKRVHERHPDAQLEIVGPDDAAPVDYIVSLSRDPQVTQLARFYERGYRTHLEEALPAAAAAKVSFTGNLPYPELVNRYLRADVFIFPSVWPEPFGMTNVEAMACGAPVIATRGGGIPEIIEDGKSGLLVERGDSVALADAILRLLDDDELRRAMGEAGKRRVREVFSWERITQDLLKEYAVLVNGTAPA